MILVECYFNLRRIFSKNFYYEILFDDNEGYFDADDRCVLDDKL